MRKPAVRTLPARASRTIEDLVGALPDAVMVVGADGIIRFVNGAAQLLFGRPGTDLIGEPLGFSVSDGSVAEINISKGKQICTAEMRVVPWVWQGKLAHLIAVRDISRLKESEARLEHLATHDPLTGLPNRRMLRLELDRSIERAQINGQKCAVLFIDLDRFKSVNDSLGHAAGDELLVKVAQRLQLESREHDLLAHSSGDEFVLVADVFRPEDAVALARRLIGAFTEPFAIGNNKVYVDTSIGISLFPDDGETADQLIDHSDAAMYRSKLERSGGYSFYSSEITRAANQRLRLEADLRNALKAGEFRLHYQRLIDLHTGRYGVEALVRWDDPQRGLIPPGDFIPICEHTGLIIPLGDWVLRTACRQMREWLDCGAPVTHVAVNLSAAQFREPAIVETIHAALDDVALPPACLELEITEGTLMNRDAEQRLDALKSLGVRLALDDFGTGYSSLAYLKRLPIDKVKIDRTFISDVPGNAAAEKLIRALIALIKGLDLEVVVEGIETEAQLQLIRAYGCDSAQGYYFGKPAPADKLAPTLQRDKEALAPII